MHGLGNVINDQRTSAKWELVADTAKFLVVYPQGEGCGFPTFGAQCAPASTGAQGDMCGMGNYCEPGFMCVIGATAGARCTQVCSLIEPSGCPQGLVCNETDVVGYGVCF